MTTVPRRAQTAARRVTKAVAKPTPVNALRAGVAVNRATGGPLATLASLVALMMLTCWVFWTYALPMLPGGWLVKKGLQYGIEHIDCQQTAVQAQPAVDPGTAGLAWVLGRGLRKVATWEPDPEAIHGALVGVGGAVGKAWGSFRSGLGDGAAPTDERPGQAQPSSLTVGCCGTGTTAAASTSGLPMNAARAIIASPAWATESPAHKVLAVAIAQAESADRPDAVNPRTVNGSRARGLWQVMLPMHADKMDGPWADPVVNANAAHAVLAAQGFDAWDTYRDGTYTAHLTAARQALDAARGTTTVCAQTGPAVPVGVATRPLGANGRIAASDLAVVPFAPQHRLTLAAAAALDSLNRAYSSQFGHDIVITDSYRTFAEQVAVRRAKPHLAAVPGTSNHGWGLAVDLSDGIGAAQSPTGAWFRQHAPNYGWVLPQWAQPDGSKPEPWHWEFVGVRPGTTA